MKIKNRQEFLVMVTIGVVLLAGLVNFILPPIQGWWSDRQKQISDLRDKVKDGAQMIKRDSVIRSHWKDMRENSLPASAPAAEQQFLKAIDNWSRDSGAELTSITPQWKSDSTNYMTLNCRVETDGDLNSLSKFIYDVEKGPMPLRLDTVELSSHDNNGQVMTLGLDINGLALLQNDQK
jgi:Tfp pilus assembly protein PilO